MADDDLRIDLGDVPHIAPPPGPYSAAPGELRGMRLLPGETILRASRRGVFTPLPELRDGLYLTQIRVIYAGRHRYWGLIPGGKSLRAAFIEDIDVGSMWSRRLHPWLLLAGLAAVLLGIGLIATDDETNANANAGAFLLLAGLGLGALWLFLRREVISFSVTGAEAFEHGYFFLSQQDTSAMTEFLNAFFALKRGLPVTERRADGSGVEI